MAAAIKPSKERAAATDRLSRIRGYLRGQGIDALVAMITEAAQRDPVLFRKLDLEAAGSTDDDETLARRLHDAVIDALTVHDVGYGEVGEWADGADAVLDRIETLIERQKAPMELRLLDSFLEELEEALQT